MGNKQHKSKKITECIKYSCQQIRFQFINNRTWFDQTNELFKLIKLIILSLGELV